MILVVDDEPDLCKTLKKVLGKEGYQVLTATSGLEALKIMKREKIDLLLVDLKMPGIDGIEVLRRSKKAKRTVPSVILTAHESLSSARESMALGAIDYLTKPFDLKEVLSVVKEALA